MRSAFARATGEVASFARVGAGDGERDDSTEEASEDAFEFATEEDGEEDTAAARMAVSSIDVDSWTVLVLMFVLRAEADAAEDVTLPAVLARLCNAFAMSMSARLAAAGGGRETRP